MYVSALSRPLALRQYCLLVNKLTLVPPQFGLSPDRMGVITPLRYQQSVIRQQISSRVSDAGDLGAIEVNTIDKYQGRDKECILVSFVRSNLKGNVSHTLHSVQCCQMRG